MTIKKTANSEQWEEDMDVASYEAGKTVSGDIGRENIVQTVTWRSGLPKEFAV